MSQQHGEGSYGTMNDAATDIPAIFTPDNEPYLGRRSVYEFDKVISSCLAANASVSEFTREFSTNLSPLQKAASQIIPQGIGIALSIRELVRQAYLFSAVVLIRPLIERAAMISYLHENPEEVRLWEAGWRYRERPSLKKMLSLMGRPEDTEVADKICETFNHVVHGDPLGATFNLVGLNEDSVGFAVGKALSEPELCDFICYQAYPYMIVLQCRAAGCFPDAVKTSQRTCTDSKDEIGNQST